MPLNPLNHHYSMENPASVYDEEAMTALELAGRTTAKVNEAVKAFNELLTETTEHMESQDRTIDESIQNQNTTINNMVNSIPGKVADEVQKNINDGTFDQAIEEYAGNLTDRVNLLLGSVPEGSTTLDAEVIDIRQGLEDEHTNAGSAVRSIENKVNTLRNNADGGFTCFHDDWDKLTGWVSEPLPPCMTTEDGTLKFYYTEGLGGNPGVAIPVRKMVGAKKIFVDFDISVTVDTCTANLWVSSQIGYAGNQCKQILKLDHSDHYSLILDVDEYPFEINYLWIVLGPDVNGLYNNLWIRFSNMVIYTNKLKEMGFKGSTIDSHLEELKNAPNTFGTSVLVDGFSTVTNPWDDNIKNPAYAHSQDGFITWTSAGDYGVGFILNEVDSRKLLRVSFDLETDFYNFNIYVGSGPNMKEDYYTLGSMKTAGHYEFTIDPAYDAVYKGFTPRLITIMAHGNCTATLKNLKIYQNAIVDAGGVESLEGNIVNLYNREVTPTVTQNTTTVTAPDGMRYLVQVDNSGGPVCVPVIPRKVLYIGNSLLSGFGHGMAASAPDKDYYYLMNQAIISKRPGLTASKLSGAGWEGMTTLSEKTAWNNNTLAPYLSADLDLVIVQLGDNVNTDEKKSVLLEGAKDLLIFIRNKCPKARVVWVGSWYGSDNLTDIAEACNVTGCQFINFVDLHTVANESAVGNTWVDASGNVTEITNPGVASHPGDGGMRAIANRILFALGITDAENYYN